ncbi:hypothetical protein Tco_0172456 [Tanacetum coccineum]
MPQEGLAIIESKSKVRYSRSRASDSRVSTDAPLSNSSSSNNSFDMQQIAASLEDKMTIKMNQMMSQMNALVVTPATSSDFISRWKTSDSFEKFRQMNLLLLIRYPPGNDDSTLKSDLHGRGISKKMEKIQLSSLFQSPYSSLKKVSPLKKEIGYSPCSREFLIPPGVEMLIPKLRGLPTFQESLRVWICQILQEISQKRTRERMSDQEAKEIKAEAREIMPQPSSVNCS